MSDNAAIVYDDGLCKVTVTRQWRGVPRFALSLSFLGDKPAYVFDAWTAQHLGAKLFSAATEAMQ